jgi:hypothetical protein
MWRIRWNENWQGKLKYSEKSLPQLLLCPPQIPHDLTRARTRAVASGLHTGNWIFPSCLLPVPSYNSSVRTPQKTQFSVVKITCLLVRYLAMDVLLLRACVTETCLPTRSLAIGLHVTVVFYRPVRKMPSNITIKSWKPPSTSFTIHLSSYQSTLDRPSNESVVKLSIIHWVNDKKYRWMNRRRNVVNPRMSTTAPVAFSVTYADWDLG